MANEQLAREYKKSLKLISNRINILRKELNKIEKDCQLSKEEKRLRNRELRERLKPLYAMHRDLRCIYWTVKNYYEPGWWRSEKYTCNSRKTRRPVLYIGNIFETSILDKLEPDPEDEEGFT